MAYTTDSDTLADLLSSLQRPTPRKSFSINSQIKRIISDGWSSRSDIEDLLLGFDGRLCPYGFGDVESLTSMFHLPWVDVADKPHKRTSGVMLTPALSVYDVASMLINLEKFGFSIDPEPLVTALLPKVEKMKVVSSSQLSVLWFSSQRHRGEPIVVKAGSGIPAAHDPALKTPTSYRVQPWRDREGKLIFLEIHAPKFRRKPDPVRTTCPECEMEYFKGDFDSGVGHRREHRARMRYLDPQPHPQMLEAREHPGEIELVTSQSPAWKHEEMYIRASAFRREFHYDFVQWGSRTGDNDPKVHGFLFCDERSAIVGACAFRHRQGTTGEHWALQWIWICPRCRRQGLLKQRWPELRRRFGDFLVEAPVSEAMKAFLLSQGDSHLAE
jgi:hypothetical protein